MALTVGELAVELEAKTGEFKRRLNEAERRLGKFEGTADKRVRRLGTSFRSLAGNVAKVGAAFSALAVALTAVAIVKIGKSAIQTAIAFEQLKVRLTIFLGSQEKANRAFAEFVELSAKTPFAVSAIVEGAATLATVTGDNEEQLAKLTKVATNLAAVTGLDVPIAAGNLQRALASGLAAADLFRDKGIRQLLEKELDLVDATKLTAGVHGDLAKAFITVFGEAGKYGTAAEDLSRTLGGALSNVSDAAERFKAELGEALAPGAMIAFRELIIPFFDSLRERVEENKDEIADFARTAVPALFGWFTKMVKVGATLIRVIGVLSVAFDGLLVVLAALQGWWVLLYGVIKAVVDVFRLGATIIANGAAAVKAALRGDIVEAARMADENAEAWRIFKLRISDTAETVKAAGSTIVDVAGDVGENRKFFDSLADGVDELAASAEQAAANLGKLEEATDAAGAAADRNAPKFTRVPLPGGLTPAGEIRAGAAPGEVAEVVEFAQPGEGFGKRPAEELEPQITEFSQALSNGIVTGVGGALVELAVSQDVQTFAQSLADLSGQFLSNAFEKVAADMEEALGKIFDALEQEMPGLGSAISAGIGLALGLISGALKETTASVTDEAIGTAITSVQQVRGVVAGPTQIAIGEVATGIQDAFDPLLLSAHDRNRILAEILVATRGGRGTEALIASSASEQELAETSVSLP